MKWKRFYENHDSWSSAALFDAIEKLEDVGSGKEVVEVIEACSSTELSDNLIKKAIELGVQITHDDFLELDCTLSDELYHELADYSGFDADTPDIDENDLSWDDFFCFFPDWSVENTIRRINKLKNIGPADEVSDAIEFMKDKDCREILYKRAIKEGIRFDHEQLEAMGKCRCNIISEDDEEYENYDLIEDDREKVEKPSEAIGIFGLIGAIFSTLTNFEKKKEHSHKCDGDCEHCPPHYGYRYGRWYYGHGHQYGCERDGNGGATGMTDRD